MTLSLNGIRAVSVRRMTPYSGAWSADVELDLGELADLPTTGPATLTIGALTLACTIDPAQSGRLGYTARARVVAGAGGWEKVVPAQNHHNDGGVFTSAVFSAAAALVGERVVELTPSRIGIDFIRHERAASHVFDGFEWRVDAAGVTTVGPRPSSPAPPGVRVLEWDARARVATIAADDVLVEPGMILTDTRFGTVKIRDVEQTWSAAGARAIANTMPVNASPDATAGAGGEIIALLGAIAEDKTKDLPTFTYRVRSQKPDGRLELDATNRLDGVPDLKLASLAPAVPGLEVKVPPGTIVHVVFVRAGIRSLPVVVRFDPSTRPISVTFNAPKVHAGTGTAPTKGPAALATPTGDAIGAIRTVVEALMTVIEGLPGGAGTTTAAKNAFKVAMNAAVPKIPSTTLSAE